MRTLSLVLLVACGPRAPAPESAPPAVPPPPTERVDADVPGPRTPDECEAEAIAADLAPGCTWEVVEFRYCGGVAPPYPGYGQRRGCLCHTCTTDADCAAGSVCQPIPALSACDHYERRMCVAPGEPCFPGTECPAGTSCKWTPGGPTCGTMDSPPP